MYILSLVTQYAYEPALAQGAFDHVFLACVLIGYSSCVAFWAAFAEMESRMRNARLFAWTDTLAACLGLSRGWPRHGRRDLDLEMTRTQDF